jgi:hypothetical protein
VPRRPIPTSVDEITPAWLTAALRERGVLRAARVVALEAETLGEGEGFVGRIARLRLRLDGSEPGAPQSLIAKLPTRVRANRATGEMLGVYEREILFYEELAADVAIRTPSTYYAALDPNPGSRYGPAILRFPAAATCCSWRTWSRRDWVTTSPAAVPTRRAGHCAPWRGRTRASGGAGACTSTTGCTAWMPQRACGSWRSTARGRPSRRATGRR